MPTKAKKSAASPSSGKRGRAQVAAELSATHTPAKAKSPGKLTKSRRVGGKSLADAIHEGLTTVGSAVIGGFADEVMKQYEEEGVAAVATLVAVVCRGAGVPVIDLDAATIMDETSVVSTLDEALARVPADMPTYGLIAKDQKKYRKAFPAFFERVADVAAAAGALLDGEFLQTLWPWLAAMIESKARHFRHTATAATFAIVKVLSELVARADLAVSTASNRKDAADAKCRLEELTQHHRQIFSGVFHTRCKDVSADIRLMAFKTFRSLIAANPALHLSNQYLRYLSIALNDKKVDIRIEALDTIVGVLGEMPEHAPRMREFLAHFATRLVEMAADTDTRVSDLALKVAALVVKFEKDTGAADAVLEEDMIDQLLMSIADDRRVMRSTAGTLLRMFIHCRVDSSAGPRVRAETLCSFATTLRTAFKEPLAERYVVDSLWVEPPPLLLADFKHYLAIARDSEADTAGVATVLGILGAIVHRCSGSIDFGPTPKDDIKVSSAAGGKGTLDPKALRSKLTKELVTFVAEALESRGSDAAIQRAAAFAVSGLDLEELSSSRLATQFATMLGELRRVTLLATEADAIGACMQAWAYVVNTDSGLRSEAEGQLQQLVRSAVKQVKDAAEGKRGGRRATQEEGDVSAVGPWRRAAALSGVVSLADHAAVFSTSLSRFSRKATDGTLAGDASSVACAEALVRTVHHTALWLAAAQQEGAASASDVSRNAGDLLPKLIAIAAMDAEGSADALALRGTAAAAAADVAALAQSVADSTQNDLIASAGDCVVALAAAVTELTAALKDAVRDAAGQQEFCDACAAVISARRRVTQFEAATTRLCMGVARLFTVNCIADESLAAQWMQLWTRVSHIKPAADAFKTLFHVLRDRLAVSDASALERDMLVCATKLAAADGASPAALDQLHAIGLKLATMHFLPTDKHYPVAVAVVKGAIEYAEGTNELILHGAAPYCARLRVPDALGIANAIEARDLFRLSGLHEQSPVVRAFVSAVRRAAKLEAVPAGATGETPGRTPGVATVGSGVAVSRTTGKTAMRKRATRGIEETIEEDDILANIVRESRNLRERTTQASQSQRSRPQPSAEDGASGWRGRGAKDAPSQSPARNRAASRSAQASQQPALTASSLMNDDEVFVATQEWA